MQFMAKFTSNCAILLISRAKQKWCADAGMEIFGADVESDSLVAGAGRNWESNAGAAIRCSKYK